MKQPHIIKNHKDKPHCLSHLLRVRPDKTITLDKNPKFDYNTVPILFQKTY
jgi:hypothetical protein